MSWRTVSAFWRGVDEVAAAGVFAPARADGGQRNALGDFEVATAQRFADLHRAAAGIADHRACAPAARRWQRRRAGNAVDSRVGRVSGGGATDRFGDGRLPAALDREEAPMAGQHHVARQVRRAQRAIDQHRVHRIRRGLAADQHHHDVPHDQVAQECVGGVGRQIDHHFDRVEEAGSQRRGVGDDLDVLVGLTQVRDDRRGSPGPARR